jgi:hypothetical protein
MNDENIKSMSGWKMKVGSFLAAIAAVIIGSAEIAPYPEIIPWLKFLGFIVGGVGTAFLAWGAGHKLEKNRNVIVKKKTIPYYVHPMNPEEFKALEKMRESREAGAPVKAPVTGSIHK